MKKVNLSWCLGDPDNPVAQDKPFMTVYESDIHNPKKMKEFRKFMTTEEIEGLMKCFE